MLKIISIFLGLSLAVVCSVAQASPNALAIYTILSQAGVQADSCLGSTCQSPVSDVFCKQDNSADSPVFTCSVTPVGSKNDISIKGKNAAIFYSVLASIQAPDSCVNNAPCSVVGVLQITCSQLNDPSFGGAEVRTSCQVTTNVNI